MTILTIIITITLIITIITTILIITIIIIIISKFILFHKTQTKKDVGAIFMLSYNTPKCARFNFFSTMRTNFSPEFRIRSDFTIKLIQPFPNILVIDEDNK